MDLAPSTDEFLRRRQTKRDAARPADRHTYRMSVC